MVSIITINFNETASTCALLDSIRQQGFRDIEVIVVDNASTEDPRQVFQTRFPEVIYLRSERNLGFAGGNNFALPHAKGDYLFFLNNDTELETDCIQHLVQLLENQDNVGLVSPLICYFQEQAESATPVIQYAGMTQVSALTGRNRTLGERELHLGQYKGPFPTAYAHGAAMMTSRKVLEQLGSMWEGFFLYYEELDWGERIRKAGFEIWVEPRALVWHKESLTLDKMGTTKTFFLARNRILFMRRNFSGWELAVFYAFLGTITLPKNILSHFLKGDFDTLKAFVKGSFSQPRRSNYTL